MRSLILSSVLLAATLAMASYDAVPFPVGESIPFFDGAFRAVELQVRDASPANGTVNIGEIAARWEIPTTNIEVSCEYADLTLTKTQFGWIGSGDYDAVSMNYGSPYDMGLPNQYYIDGSSAIFFDLGDFIGRTNDVIDSISIGDQFELFGLTIAGYGEFQYTGHSITCRVVSVSIPHATTNALWSVTATNGAGKASFAPGTMEFFAPGREFVRYGTATNGSCLLFIED